MSARTVTTFAEFIALKKLDARKPILQTEIDQIVNNHVYLASRPVLVASDSHQPWRDSTMYVTGHCIPQVRGRARGDVSYYASCYVMLWAGNGTDTFDVTLTAVTGTALYGAGGSAVIFSGAPGTTPTWRGGATTLLAAVVDDFNLTITRTAGTDYAYLGGHIIYAP
jgi:hypothetical protein